MNAINAYNRLNVNVSGMKKASEKLSSGYRINRAGDDAAGLAISEKMRSQIRGLGQAKRNAQDGISMMQTFEGAAQETHTILQRMKELATESANGTYDNATDRAAIQLEFDQLNDELNQIADTDFNGTVVLNGGEMADGLKQVNGEFNYANKKDQLIDNATKMASEAVAKANDDYYAALKKFNETPYDLSSNGDAPEWKSVAENNYGKTMADNLWIDLGITKKNEDGDDVADVSRYNAVDVTFTYKEGSGWEATSVVTNEGNSINPPTAGNEWKDVFTVTEADLADANGKGGFTVETGKMTDKVNAVFDATKVKDGDTVTLKFTNSEPSVLAPNNAGWADDSVIGADGSSTIIVAGVEHTLAYADDAANTNAIKASDLTVTLKLADAKITENVAKSLETLNGQDISFTLKTGGANNKYAPENDKITIGGQELSLGTAGYSAGTGVKLTLKDADGNDVDYFVTWKEAKTGTTNTLQIYDAKYDATGNAQKGDNQLLEIDFSKYGAAIGAAYDAAAADVTASFSGKLAIAATKYDAGVTPDVSAADNPNLESSAEASKLLDAAKAAQAAATKQLADITGAEDKYAAAKEYLTKNNVSVSDAFDKSTARMTYTDNITLQTGARTKDAVNFTFNYNLDKTADMGELKANLNLSSREDGLNTANLSLADQDSANYAIDQIDKAINKTSMVRASFGAIQNRLEHKIDNLTTTNENLTEAESNIRDTDMASTMMDYTKFNILQQAAQSMLAQANQQPQSILQLLG